jgi:hypothetical protein
MYSINGPDRHNGHDAGGLEATRSAGRGARCSATVTSSVDLMLAGCVPSVEPVGALPWQRQQPDGGAGLWLHRRVRQPLLLEPFQQERPPVL